MGLAAADGLHSRGSQRGVPALRVVATRGGQHMTIRGGVVDAPRGRPAGLRGGVDGVGMLR